MYAYLESIEDAAARRRVARRLQAERGPQIQLDILCYTALVVGANQEVTRVRLQFALLVQRSAQLPTRVQAPRAVQRSSEAHKERAVGCSDESLVGCDVRQRDGVEGGGVRNIHLQKEPDGGISVERHLNFLSCDASDESESLCVPQSAIRRPDLDQNTHGFQQYESSHLSLEWVGPLYIPRRDFSSQCLSARSALEDCD